MYLMTENWKLRFGCNSRTPEAGTSGMNLVYLYYQAASSVCRLGKGQRCILSRCDKINFLLD